MDLLYMSPEKPILTKVKIFLLKKEQKETSNFYLLRLSKRNAF